MTRRSWLALFAGTSAAKGISWPGPFRAKVAAFLESHRRPEGAYGWSSDVIAHITPTFGAVGSYRLFGMKLPQAERVADFARNVYPVPEVRRKDRPLWRLDFEQVQTLLWLNQPIDSFLPLAATWKRPAAFTKVYEMGGNPVFQHQAMAVRVRRLLGLTPSEEDSAWREYFLARRRPDGTFNSTPAEDGSGGHLMNTLWGLQAAECLGLDLPASHELAGWVKACQLASGGFTYAPKASPGGVEDIAYTWCALQILEKLGELPISPAQCAAWVESLFAPEGGFQDRPGGEPNPLATFYALDSLRLLKRTPKGSVRPASRARRNSIPAGSEVFSIQVQAPGNGSPGEAALMAGALGIQLWTAKNSAPGWIEEAQQAADAARVPVRFAVASEEYGIYVAVPGLGCYSHLVDLVAPYEAGKSVVWKRSDRRPDLVTATGLLEKTEFPYPWEQFRDSRIAALKNARGRMIWQFLENEELTRILLDEAALNGAFAAISTFHFGNENFLHSQPFLHRWYDRLPFVGLQDAHAQESWWWGDQLAGFTTLFIGKDPTWESWLAALERNHVMAVRHDVVTGWKTHMAGGSPEVREFVKRREAQWRWWDEQGKPSRRPAAAMTLLRPGMRFEAGVPEAGLALRIRLWQQNTGQGLPREPRTELVSLQIDGSPVEPKLVETKADRYFLYSLEDKPGVHQAAARVRVLETGEIKPFSIGWETRG